jgi:hypothetical protein
MKFNLKIMIMVYGHIRVENFVHFPSSEAKHCPGFKTVYIKQIHLDVFCHFFIVKTRAHPACETLCMGGRLNKRTVPII